MFQQENENSFFSSCFSCAQQFLVCICFRGEGKDDSRMGNVGNVKMQKDKT